MRRRAKEAAAHSATCGLPVLDTAKRARICGAPATMTREIEGVAFHACALCAASFDATGKARTLTSEEEAQADARLDARRKRGDR